jgi:hypothetical protein
MRQKFTRARNKPKFAGMRKLFELCRCIFEGAI